VKANPFASIDQTGVGNLMEIAIERAQPVRPGIKLGICGEHGGDPSTIEFCQKIGLTYVSCSPFRVPIARLAAAQAALRQSSKAPAAAKSTKAAKAVRAKKAPKATKAKPAKKKLKSAGARG
jgi:pyruvate,orthophosphate dikinase